MSKINDLVPSIFPINKFKKGGLLLKYNADAESFSYPEEPLPLTKSIKLKILKLSKIPLKINEINVKNQYYSNISDIARWGYLGEPNSASVASGVAKAPFFRSIRIYGFNQHSFALYELVNPIIERFEHDTYFTIRPVERWKIE